MFKADIGTFPTTSVYSYNKTNKVH